MEISAEATVIGGGLAGCAAAIMLARAGRDVVLVEREPAPHHKVCGEFLSQEALLYLRDLGVDAQASGAVSISGVRLAGAKHVVQRPLPFAAMSLTRKRLDEDLLRCAEASGVRVMRGAGAESLAADEGTWTATLTGGDAIIARSVFQATGKHDLRGHPRPPGKQRGLIAFKMYWRLTPAQTGRLAKHVELLLYRGGYAGLQPVEGGVANLCCLIDSSELQRLGGRWDDLLHAMRTQCPHLDDRLQGAEPLLSKPLAIASLPYGFVRDSTAGLWHLGDQAAVIPSFTGDGMSLALHSGMLAAKMYLAGGTPHEFQQQFAQHAKNQVRFATAIFKALIAAPTLSLFAVQLWPHALQTIAKRTRIPQQSLLTTSLS